MEQILLNPGVLALIGSVFVAGLAYLQYWTKHKDNYRKSKLTVDEKRRRLLYWYVENFHKLRRIVIENGLEDKMNHIPIEPPARVLEEKEESI